MRALWLNVICEAAIVKLSFFNLLADRFARKRVVSLLTFPVLKAGVVSSSRGASMYSGGGPCSFEAIICPFANLSGQCLGVDFQDQDLAMDFL